MPNENIIMWLIGGACGVGVFAAHMISRLAKVELKIDTVWEFLVRRAVSEAVVKGVATINSPVRLAENAREWLEPLKSALTQFYARQGHGLTDGQLMMAIEQQFGDRIFREVCIPHGLWAGACLVLAAEIAKGDGRQKNVDNCAR